MEAENSNDKSTQTKEPTSNEVSGSAENRDTTNNEENGSIRSHASSSSSTIHVAEYSAGPTMMPVISSDESTENRDTAGNGNGESTRFCDRPCGMCMLTCALICCGCECCDIIFDE
jgi:hypothetical protein